MIDAALNAGALGAKIVGSGKGGSIVALAPEGKEQQVIDSIKNAGAVDAYLVSIDTGARII
jgi:galactokinase